MKNNEILCAAVGDGVILNVWMGICNYSVLNNTDIDWGRPSMKNGSQTCFLALGIILSKSCILKPVNWK